MRVEMTELDLPVGEPLGQAEFKRMGSALVTDLKKRSPVDTGALKASIRAVVGSDGVAVEALDYAHRQKALQDPDPSPIDAILLAAVDDWLGGEKR